VEHARSVHGPQYADTLEYEDPDGGVDELHLHQIPHLFPQGQLRLPPNVQLPDQRQRHEEVLVHEKLPGHVLLVPNFEAHQVTREDRRIRHRVLGLGWRAHGSRDQHKGEQERADRSRHHGWDTGAPTGGQKRQ